MTYKFPNLDLKRREINMTKTAFSKQIGISTKTYLNWQKYGNIPAIKLIGISQLLNCSIDYLLEQDEVQNESNSN